VHPGVVPSTGKSQYMVHAFRVTLIFIDDKIAFLLDVHASNASVNSRKQLIDTMPYSTNSSNGGNY
jgi:hypothetical protein